MITGVHHISIIASCEKSVDFYKLIGFKEVFRKNRDYDTVVILDGFGIQLEIFVDPSHPERATSPENLGFRNISLKVDKIEEEMERFKDIEFGNINTDWFGVRYCIIKDYDGLPIQLHE